MRHSLFRLVGRPIMAAAAIHQLMKSSFAGHGPAPQNSHGIDLLLWGGAMRCQGRVISLFEAAGSAGGNN